MVRFPIKLVHCSQHALNYGLWVAKPYIPKLRVSTQFIVDEITSQQKKCKTEGHLQIWGVGKPCTPRTWNHEFYFWHKWVVTLWANPINSHICNQWSCHVRVPAFLWYVCEVVISSHYQSETTWTPQHLVGWLVFSSPSHHNIPKQVHCFKLPLENSVSGMESSATEMLNHFKVTNFVPPPRRHI